MKENITLPVGTCTSCGKFCWTTKKNAKNGARRNHPNERLSVYECNGYWHYGHLDYPVLRGFKARGDF